MEPLTVTVAGGAVLRVRNANEKAKWCKCGHRHKKKSASKSRHKRRAKCSEPGCGCETFRTQASDTELLMAKGWGKSKQGLKNRFKALQ